MGSREFIIRLAWIALAWAVFVFAVLAFFGDTLPVFCDGVDPGRWPCIRAWQPTIAALIAFLIGFPTVLYLRGQLKEQEHQRQVLADTLRITTFRERHLIGQDILKSYGILVIGRDTITRLTKELVADSTTKLFKRPRDEVGSFLDVLEKKLDPPFGSFLDGELTRSINNLEGVLAKLFYTFDGLDTSSPRPLREEEILEIRLQERAMLDAIGATLALVRQKEDEIQFRG